MPVNDDTTMLCRAAQAQLRILPIKAAVAIDGVKRTIKPG